MITLIDVEKKLAREIAKDLCAFFHQESVLVTESETNAYFINETVN